MGSGPAAAVRRVVDEEQVSARGAEREHGGGGGGRRRGEGVGARGGSLHPGSTRRLPCARETDAKWMCGCLESGLPT